jgi:aryl-alcohol dehydrogenase-like predicted oxidoreductase
MNASAPASKRQAEPRLVLGTAQFGLAYGIAGRGESVPEYEARAILEDAVARGVDTLDTAAAYGDIETRLGRLVEGLPLRVISKIPAIPNDLGVADAVEFALAAARQSRQRLGPALSALMMHRGDDLLRDAPRGQALSSALREWTTEHGLIFGASCYGPDEASSLAQQHGITLIQLPGNAFDQRVVPYADEPALQGVSLHMRSTFLQGLLLMPIAQGVARLPVAADQLRKWHAHCTAHHQTPLEAALSVAKSFDNVSALVLGVDRLAQWREIADAWDRVAPQTAPELACTLTDIIDPRQWKLNP